MTNHTDIETLTANSIAALTELSTAAGAASDQDGNNSILEMARNHARLATWLLEDQDELLEAHTITADIADQLDAELAAEDDYATATTLNHLLELAVAAYRALQTELNAERMAAAA